MFIATLFLISCGGKKEITGDELVKKVLEPEKVSEDEMTTARGAYDDLKPEFEKLMAGKTVRLGKISGTSIQENGKGKTWAFVFYADKDAENVDEFSFGWVKGKLSSGQETVWSTGLNTPDYDYMFKDIGLSGMVIPGCLEKNIFILTGLQVKKSKSINNLFYYEKILFHSNRVSPFNLLWRE
jgi:hypothetical protein